MIPRVMHRVYAETMGYFWLPCPVCKEPFGGHEWRDVDDLSSSVPSGEPFVNHGICPRCTAEGYGYPIGWERVSA